MPFRNLGSKEMLSILVGQEHRKLKAILNALVKGPREMVND